MRDTGICPHKLLSAIFLSCLLGAVLGSPGGAQAGQAAGLALEAAPEFVVNPTGPQLTFIAYGDMRMSDPADTTDSSPAVRQKLLNKIAQEKPPLLVITGDLVLRGGTANDWAVWEKESKPLRDEGVKIFPVAGNHELYGDQELNHYFQHFPELKRARWYSIRYGNCYFLMLDSDLDQKDGAEWKWLEGELDHLAPAIDFVFIALHHPLMTRSSEISGGHSLRPREATLAEMLEHHQSHLRQRLIVLAGHVHNYERYEHGGVTYITTGGGGATPYEIQRNATDAYQDSGPTYHFCRFQISGNRLQMRMIKLNLGGNPEWPVRDSFRLFPVNATAGRVSAQSGK